MNRPRMFFVSAIVLALLDNPSTAAIGQPFGWQDVSTPPSRITVRLRESFALEPRSELDAMLSVERVRHLREQEAVERRSGVTPERSSDATEQAIIDAMGLAPLRALGQRVVRSGALSFRPTYAGIIDGREAIYQTYSLEYPPSADVAAIARDLMQATEVAWAEPVAVFQIADMPPAELILPFPNDLRYTNGSQWGLHAAGGGPFSELAGNDIRAPEAWAISTGNTSVVVSILDTGIDGDHPELQKTLSDGSSRIVHPYEVLTTYQDWGVLHDPVGHGTAVAGVAAALTNNGGTFGNDGMAGVIGGAGGDSVGCRILPVKVTGGVSNTAGSDDMATGLLYAVAHGARAANFSFGGPYAPLRVFHEAVDYAATHHCVVVIGAGNSGPNGIDYPGAHAEYGYGIAVGAIAPNGQIASFSTQGPQITVAAPGKDIVVTLPTYENYYGSPLRNIDYTSGTSFAAPFVTGLAGLASAVAPSLEDNEFEAVLTATARDYGTPGRDNAFGYGMPDAGSLLSQLASPHVIVRGTAAATSWSLVSTGTLDIQESDIIRNGCSINHAVSPRNVEKWEAVAHVMFPHPTSEPPLVLVRRHSTNGWRDTDHVRFDTTDGEVVPGSVTASGCDVRTHMYYLVDGPSYCQNQSPQGWVPRPPEEAVIAWSAIGEFDTTVYIGDPGPPIEDPYCPSCNESALGWDTSPVTPNPAIGSVTLRIRRAANRPGSADARIAVFDVRGRKVRELVGGIAPGASGQFIWDGRDDAGRFVDGGIYFARILAPDAPAAVRFAYLGR